MKIYTLNLHSSIDVITNSSTEIFATANKHGIDNIKTLITNIIKMVDANLNFEDVISDIFIAPTNQIHILSLYAHFLSSNEHLLDDKMQKNYIEAFNQCYKDIPAIIDAFNDFFPRDQFLNIFEHGDNLLYLFFESKHKDSIRTHFDVFTDEFNRFNYDSCIETQFYIIVEDDNYKELVKNIMAILGSNCYTYNAIYTG